MDADYTTTRTMGLWKAVHKVNHFAILTERLKDSEYETLWWNFSIARLLSEAVQAVREGTWCSL